jgi:hypothetical protein
MHVMSAGRRQLDTGYWIPLGHDHRPTQKTPILCSKISQVRLSEAPVAMTERDTME